jgi:aminoglycoside 6-adenylyltransferase
MVERNRSGAREACVSETQGSSARAAVTGVLLLGGASSRFGSPKALAELRGLTLAERAWRLLGEACAERIAVGKGDLGFPFDVLLEPPEPRAPIVGLVTALRAAPTDTVVALPVDCPLVTGELLRTLAEERAVPQTGPLPGAYTKEHLPELERRLAAGEHSLRGVNERVCQVDPVQLLDVDTRRDLALAATVAWAQAHEDVRALVLVGSLSRADTPADEWSDIDVVALVDDPARYLDDAGWVHELGRPLLTFVEPTALRDGFERRVLLEGGVDVDVVPVAAAGADERLEAAGAVLRRGFAVLHDELGIAPRLAEAAARPVDPVPLPTPQQVDELCADLWYHGLWTAKKLARGELWTATECLDGHLRYRLLDLLRWRALLAGRAPWHGVRFVEQWAGEPAEALAATFGGYGEDEIRRALWGLLDLSERLERELRERLGLPEADRTEVARLIADVQPR